MASLDKFLKHIVSVEKGDKDMVDDIAESPLPAKIGAISRALKKTPKKDKRPAPKKIGAISKAMKKAPKKNKRPAPKKKAQRHCRVSDVVVS